jgi:predicted enzyme related to lactoylglutathione lyase
VPAKKTAKRHTAKPAATAKGAGKSARGAKDARSRSTGPASSKSTGSGSHPAKKKAASVAKKPAAKKPATKSPAIKTDAPPPVPNAMGLAVSHSDYTTHNFEEVRRFYTQQLGFSRFKYDPNFRYLWIQTTHQSSLGFMPPMPGGEMPLPPREPTIYFMVRDIDEAYRKLQARGVSFEAPPETMPWGHRLVRTRDPEGRSIVLAEDVSSKNK